MRALRKYAGSRREIGRAIKMISNDEDNHLAYCHEELLRLASAGLADTIQRRLRDGSRRDRHLPRRQKGCHGTPSAHPELVQAESRGPGNGHPGRVPLRTARRLAPGWCPCRHRPGATHSADEAPARLAALTVAQREQALARWQVLRGTLRGGCPRAHVAGMHRIPERTLRTRAANVATRLANKAIHDRLYQI